MSKLREVSIDMGTEFGLTKKIIVKSIFINIGIYDDDNGNKEATLDKSKQSIRVDYQVIWLKDDNTIFKEKDGYYIQNDESTLSAWDGSTTSDELGKAFSDRIIWYMSNNIIPNLYS